MSIYDEHDDKMFYIFLATITVISTTIISLTAIWVMQ